MPRNTQDNPQVSMESARTVQIVRSSTNGNSSASSQSAESGTPLPHITDGLPQEKSQEVDREASLLRTSTPGGITVYHTFEALGVPPLTDTEDDNSTIRNLSPSSPIPSDEKEKSWLRKIWKGLLWLFQYGGSFQKGKAEEEATAGQNGDEQQPVTDTFEQQTTTDPSETDTESLQTDEELEQFRQIMKTSRAQRESQWAQNPIPQRDLQHLIQKRESYVLRHSDTEWRWELLWQAYLYRQQLEWQVVNQIG